MFINSFKKWAIPSLFFFISSFQNTVDSKQMFNLNINPCRWLDSNRGPPVLEATAQPTEPQPLPCLSILKLFSLTLDAFIYSFSLSHSHTYYFISFSIHFLPSKVNDRYLQQVSETMRNFHRVSRRKRSLRTSPKFNKRSDSSGH